jgi:tetratricopeptide (TPR) repeat protein
LKKFLVILTLSQLLLAPVISHAASDDEPATAAHIDGLPSLALSEEVLFKYLSAEIADQRGNTLAAYSTMMSIARTTRDARLIRRATEMAMSGKLSSEALKAASLWIEVAPHSEEAAQVLLSLQLATNQTEEAKKTLALRLAKSAPSGLAGVIGQIQRLLSRMPDKTKSAALLKELLEPYHDSLDVKLILAQLSMTGGDQQTAIREAKEALAKNPKSELAALTLAQIVGDKAEAAKTLAEFLQKNPNSRDVRMAYARILFEQSKLDEAKKEFKTLLQQYPEDQTVLYAMGLLSAQANELSEAERYLSSYIKTLNGKADPDRDATQALMILAQIAEDRNDLDGALNWVNLVETTGQSGYLGAILKRAQLKAKSGKLDEARQLLSQTDVESDDERVKLLIGEAQLLRDAGKLNEAIHVMEDALERFPDNTDLLYEHAMIAEKNKQPDVMEQSLRKIIKLRPDNPHPYNALGYSLADRGERLPEAYDLIKKALELAPEDPYIMDSMGWVEFRMGRFEKAEEILRRAFAIKPDPEIAVHLGEVLWVKGREDEAKNLWRSAIGKDPKNETLKSTLLRLQVKL